MYIFNQDFLVEANRMLHNYLISHDYYSQKHKNRLGPMGEY